MEFARDDMEMDNGEEVEIMEEEDPDFVPRKGPLFPAVSATDAAVRDIITFSTLFCKKPVH
jgi:hypothetical protein